MIGTKKAIRREMRLRRRSLPTRTVEEAGRAVARAVAGWTLFRSARTVVLYMATDGEVSTAPLLALSAQEGKRILLPRVEGRRLAFVDHRLGDGTCTGVLGIEEPMGEEVDPGAYPHALALVPLVAWDRAGGRLGRGGAYYDRALARVPATWHLAGLAYSFQQHAMLPTEPWDVPLSYVVTEEGVVRCSRGVDDSPKRKEEAKRHGLDMDDPGGRRAGVPAGPADREDSAAAGRGSGKGSA